MNYNRREVVVYQGPDLSDSDCTWWAMSTVRIARKMVRIGATRGHHPDSATKPGEVGSEASRSRQRSLEDTAVNAVVEGRFGTKLYLWQRRTMDLTYQHARRGNFPIRSIAHWA